MYDHWSLISIIVHFKMIKLVFLFSIIIPIILDGEWVPPRRNWSETRYEKVVGGFIRDICHFVGTGTIFSWHQKHTNSRFFHTKKPQNSRFSHQNTLIHFFWHQTKNLTPALPVVPGTNIRYVTALFVISIVDISTLLKNIDIDIDKEILENIDIN